MLPFALAPAAPHDSPEWHERRREGIGGSDAAALIGQDPYRDATTLFLEKLGVRDSSEGSEAARWGQVLEGPVAAEWAHRAHVEVQPTRPMYDPEHPHRRGEPDRLVYVDGALDAGLEVKVTSRGDEWGEDDADPAGPMPPRFEVQCLHYQLVSGLDRWYVAALLSGRGGMRLAQRTRVANAPDLAGLASVEDRFWYDRVLPAREAMANGGDWLQYAPEPGPHTRDALAALHLGDATVDLDADADEWCREWTEAVARQTAATTERARLEARLIIALGRAGAEAGFTPDGWRVTYKARRHLDADRFAHDHPAIAAAVSVPKVSVSKLRAEHPELAAEYDGPGSPVLRITAPRTADA